MMKIKKRVNLKGKASSASHESPKQSTIDNKTTSTSKQSFKCKKPIASTLFISPSPSPTPSPMMNNNNNNKKNTNLSTISDLKEMAASRVDDLKRNLIDRSHSEILKDIEASHSRLHKRFKIQTQTGEKMMDESEKEYKKMCERIAETQDAMKASYAEFLEDAQSTASTVCKTSIPDLSRSFEKAIGAIQSRYGIRST